MATLIAVYNSEGCVGRCDARCYEAITARCTCICGGKNHRAGKQAAMDNVREMVGLSREDLEKYAQAHGLDPDKLAAIDTSHSSDWRTARERGLNSIGQLDFICEKA